MYNTAMEMIHAGAKPQLSAVLVLWGLALLLLFAALRLRQRIHTMAEWKKRSFSRKLEMALLPRETVKVICPQRKGCWVLTGKRLLRDTEEGFTAVKLGDIQKIQGFNAAGNRTTVAKNMVRLVVQGEQQVELQNTGEEFVALTEQLQKKLRKKKKR